MPVTDVITSAANPLVKRIRALADRRSRRREGAFVVMGVQPVWRAIEADWRVDTLVVVPEVLPDSAAEMVARQSALGVPVARLSAELAGRLTERDRPPGLLAVVRTRTTMLEELRVDADAVFAALHTVGNPGNLGTIVRTVDAVGAAGVILIGDTADPFAPAAVKASMGSLFTVPIATACDTATFLRWARQTGVHLVATSGGASAPHWSSSYPPPVAILLGSEGDGLPAELLARADQRVAIPMVGTAESLNLAVAAALMLYEARRGRVGGGGGPLDSHGQESVPR
jgi:TrmH family RNA methyltransferase